MITKLVRVGGVSILVLTVSFLSSCTWFMQEKEPKAAIPFVVVNVLGSKYYQDCHIKGSINVDMEALEDFAQKHWDKNSTEVVVYCANYKCTASSEGARMLKDLGFKKVWAYEGGTAEWKQLGYPVEGPCASGYLNDFAQPADYTPEHDVDIITAQVLKEKFDYYNKP